MKQISSIIFASIVLFFFTACNTNSNSSTDNTETNNTETNNTETNNTETNNTETNNTETNNIDIEHLKNLLHIETTYFPIFSEKNSRIINPYVFKPRDDTKAFGYTLPLDWEIDPFTDNNWRYQLHAWRMLDPRLIKFDETHNLSLLDDIILIMKDWKKFTIDDNKITKYTWHDMATGLRAIKLAYLLNNIYSEENIGSELSEDDIYFLIDLAKIHLEELKNQKISPNNHGFFQLHGLHLLAQVIPNQTETKAYTQDKMKELLKNQFLDDGFHSENSDKYHHFMVNMTSQYIDIKLYPQLGSTIKILERAKQNSAYLQFPNDESLMIGDSGYSKANKFTDQNVTHGIKYFDKSGYTFIHDRKDGNITSKIFFQTAFNNITHRHADDFNVLLYEFGVNILVDAGLYSYDEKNNYRKYIRSTRAHNSLQIDNRDYDILSNFYDNTLVKNSKEQWGGYHLSTKLFREEFNLTHNRHLIYLPTKFLLVLDNIDAEDTHNYKQNFHFHQDLDISIIRDNTYVADIGNTTMTVITNRTSSITKGQTEPTIQGWRSLSYNEVTANFALENFEDDTSTYLATIFYFQDANNKSDIDFEIIEYNEKFEVNVGDSVNTYSFKVDKNL